jgi:hypothetical protein
MILLKREWCAAAALLALFAVPARAQTAPQDPAADGRFSDGRFSMTPVANGFLRLDTRTGQTSLCTVNGEQAQCRASADERAAFDAEIARLTRENAELRGRVAASSQPPAASKVPAPLTAQDEEDRRFDRNMDRAETFMRRMLRLFRDSEKPAPPSL